ncbi:MAG TPA: zinc-binding dehydrogenase [Chloroflexota bacterium]|nr:zinc-binding dehydrogenase [Chloroflexota bacterium]
MQTTMKAVRYYGPGQPLRLEDVPRPRLADGEALLKVRAAGVCHTELHLLDGVLNLGVTPLVPGHEVVADVVEVRARGAAVGAGQRVLLWYYAPCGSCVYCRGGVENLCPNAARQFGFTADGGYAEYLVAPVGSLVPLPDILPDAEAVGLACGGATALHAARTIGEVRLGETAVIYGVGGVGFYLIQICRLAGARVIAVGRSPTKLARAQELGAHATVDARQEDPLAAIQALTDGRGADIVFDLVASQETLELAPRALARRGRLVYCGYGADRGALNPLLLVLREIQLRGAVGNTLSELQETIRLAASGQLRSVVGGTFRLDQANEALAALRGGAVVGRAVLVVGEGASLSAAPRGLTPNPSPPPMERGEPPSLPSVPLNSPSPAGCPQGRERGRGGEATPPTPGPRPFEAELLAFIRQGMENRDNEEQFDALARGLFAYQFDRNEPYRKFCELKGSTPETVGHWTEIPAVPIGAFKEVTLACESVEGAAALFMSSGTTRPEQRSRHYQPSLAVYDASITTNFAAQVLPDKARLPFLVLNPEPSGLPNSSLAYYLGVMRDRYGDVGSDYFVTDAGLQHERLVAALLAARRENRPVCLLGTTFAFVHFLDRLAAEGERVALPEGSRVFDTGGVKGRSREISREELTEAITTHLGVPSDYQVNMYGLTELSTQFIDANLRLRAAGLPPETFKTVPPWARTRILDPETLRELPAGEVGLLCHTDLANRASVCTILTEDLGVWRGDGFEILGRVQGSQARGCSIAMDELLSATGGKA